MLLVFTHGAFISGEKQMIMGVDVCNVRKRDDQNQYIQGSGGEGGA